MNQLNSVVILTPYVSKIHFDISLPPAIPQWPFPLRVSDLDCAWITLLPIGAT
jgi:hypothetical protein